MRAAAGFHHHDRQVIDLPCASGTGPVGRVVIRPASKRLDRIACGWQDSGNYKRYPIRNGDGEITDGCGIDLRILIVRYAELDELVRQVRAQKKAADAALPRGASQCSLCPLGRRASLGGFFEPYDGTPTRGLLATAGAVDNQMDRT
ncbi:helix-turn-helix domain-containing protein [Sinorhizobium medicae]